MQSDHRPSVPSESLPSSNSLTLYSIDTNLTHQQQTAVENIVAKEEIARNEQFLLFPQCFLLNELYPHLSVFLTSYLYLLLNWKSPKLAYWVKVQEILCVSSQEFSI